MAGVLGIRVTVCGSNEGDNELLNRVEQLLTKVSIDRPGYGRPLTMLGMNMSVVGTVLQTYVFDLL
jgi:hypothetical protein